jgi:hypothetical protein
MTWKREQGYSKYREQIRWLQWDIVQKDKRIKELELLVRVK